MLFLKRTFISSIFILLIAPFASLYAQSCDWTTIDDGQKNYEVGKFDKVISEMKSCINKGFNSAQQVQAYRLLSKSYLVTDQDSAAYIAASSLIGIQADYQPDYISDPPKFIQIIEKLKKEGITVTVTSVSKKAEKIEEAPATVILITEKQIKRRGYLDLEALVHDLPGFDISRSNGNLYTHAYQRGYRSINTNRTLFLIDGVEENDLWSGNVYLSRQYSMSNIKNVEIVYGPASTMYGSNAFLGVINIITKQPEDFIKKDNIFGANAVIGYGSYNTKFADASFAVGTKNKNVVFSLSGRLFLSDEQDLSYLAQHDYKPAEMTDELGAAYHSKLDITDSTGVADFLAINPSSSSMYSLSSENQIILTDLGIATALKLDNDVYDKVEFADKTEAYSLDAKLKIYDFLIGWSGWKKAEGPGSQYNDTRMMSANEGFLWQPVHNFFYMKYEKDIIKDLSISNFMRYKIHDFDQDNSIVMNPRHYSNGAYNLEDLIVGNIPTWFNIYLFQKSSQLRNEFKVIYSPTPKLDIITGFEARFSSIQGNYLASSTNDAEEMAIIDAEDMIPGGNQIYSQDLGVYAQASYLVVKQLKLTLGGRFDNNKIRETQGFGNVFNPRAAIVYMPSNFIFKAIYSEAFKDATNREKYSTSDGKRELSNPTLAPEKVKNAEFTTGYKLNKTSTINISAYYSLYSGIIQEVEVERLGQDPTNQNQAVGKAEIYGVNAFADYNFSNFNFYANYTYTVPYTIPTDSIGNPLIDADGTTVKIRISDIASHQANLGVNYNFRNYLNFNLRSNIMGTRITGENTTVPTNLETFSPYVILNGAVTYDHEKSGLSIQSTVFNILNKEYSSPGLDSASGILASKLIQNKRNFNIKLMYRF